MSKSRSFKFTRPKPYDPFETFALVPLGPRDPSFERIERRGWRVLRWIRGCLCAVTVGWNQEALVFQIDGPEEAIGDVESQHASALLGLESSFRLQLERDDPLKPYLKRQPGLRLIRAFWLYEGALQIVLNQRVSWAEASENWRQLCRRHGQRQDGLCSAPSPAALLALSWAEFAQCGIEQKRAVAMIGVASRLDSFPPHDLTGDELEARIDGLPRIGPWTKTLIRGQIWADPDAVPLGDYGLPSLVCRALAGERSGSDERMLELLEPYRGQRFWVLRHLWSSGNPKDRRGPRLPVGQGIGTSASS